MTLLIPSGKMVYLLIYELDLVLYENRNLLF
jgi:hypothetical protein